MIRIVVWDEPARVWLSGQREDEGGFAAALSKNLDVPWLGVCGGDGNGFCSSSSLCTVTIFLWRTPRRVSINWNLMFSDDSVDGHTQNDLVIIRCIFNRHPREPRTRTTAQNEKGG